MYAQATLYDYWMAVYSRKGIILLVSLSAMVCTLVISYYMPPVYVAKATLYLPANNLSSSYVTHAPQNIAQPALRPFPDEKEAGVDVGVLKSNDTAEKVHARFPERDLAFFKKNVDFVTSPQFFVDIYVRDRDPELAARIANSYVEFYSEFHVELLKRKAMRAQRVLEVEQADIQRRLAAKSEEISQFKQEKRLLSSAEAEQLAFNQTQQLDRERNEVIVALQSIQEQVKSAEKAGAKVGGSDDLQILSNPLIERKRRLESRRNALTERIDRLRSSAPGTVTTVATMQKLESERRFLEQLRDSVELNLAEARMQSVSPIVDIVQVQTARPPTTPSFPIHALNGLVALVLGFAAACYVALLLSYLGRLRVERIRRNLADDRLVRELQP
jgi:uncharacterized protein involved in exopolysaccharide biosynthesis